MSEIPETPSAFFTEFLPAQFAALPPSVQATIAGKSSQGALICRVPGAGEWSLRLDKGALQVTTGAAQDAVLQLTIDEADFAPLLVEGARAHATQTPSIEKQVLAFKVLLIDAERARLVRSIPGSLTFAIKDADRVRKINLTPGNRVPKIDNAECRIDCIMSDFRDMQTGKQLPMQLFMNGKMKMVGNAQIPMALSTVFA